MQQAVLITVHGWAGQPRARVEALCCLMHAARPDAAADVNGVGCRATLGTG